MNNNTKARVFHFDLHGKREEKYDFLSNQSIESIQWAELVGKEPGYLFVIKDIDIENQYNNGISLNEIWGKFNPGVETGKDEFFINDNKNVLIERFKELNDKILQQYGIKDITGFNLSSRLRNQPFNIQYITNYLSKPFDYQFCYYDPKVLRRASYEIQKHIIKPNNFFLLSKRGRLLGSNSLFSHISISNQITDKNFLADQSYCFPLYLYHETKNQTSITQTTDRTPNLNQIIVDQIAEQLALTFTTEKEDTAGTFAPIDMLDYIYAVLHSPTYRAKYKEFLKIDFPRVPYPKDPETFWELVKLGGELRQIHLLESPVVVKFITTYPNDGTNQVIKLSYDDGKVKINDQQYFDNVPPIAWNFYIGGYQPAQKWLKDRKGRTLSFDDIMHYQKIIVALSETDRIMKEIDKIEIE